MDDEKIICPGCGAQIQTDDEKKAGYVPSSAMTRDVVICKRCFRIKHYEEVENVSLSEDDFLRLLHQISEREALVVKVIDLFDVNGSWISGIHRFVGSNDVLLVANKVDLLPASVNKSKVLQWLQKTAKDWGIKPKEIKLMSAESGEGVERVAAAMERLRKGKDIFVVGMTNVGKSTFINSLISRFDGDQDQLITTSPFPGTTLSTIDLPLDDGKKLYDTPGIVNHRQVSHYLTGKELKAITPKKKIKPRIYQLEAGQTLFFGGLARMDFIEGENNAFVCYFSNELPIHRTKLEKADRLYQEHKGALLSPPGRHTLGELPPITHHDFVNENEKTDVVISGLGWVTITNSNAKVRIHAPGGIEVSTREAIL